MTKRFVVLMALFLLATSGVAHAGGGYSSDNSITSDKATYGPGGDAQFVAKVFLPASTVTFNIFSAPVLLGAVPADANGVALINTKLPSNLPAGLHRVEASGTGADGLPLTVSTTITVGATGGGNLPRTGSDGTIPLTQVGVAAVAAGGLLVLVARRRRGSSGKKLDATV